MKKKFLQRENKPPLQTHLKKPTFHHALEGISGCSDASSKIPFGNVYTGGSFLPVSGGVGSNI